MEHRIPRWQILIVPITLAIITFLVYYPSLHFAFLFDDLPNIAKQFNIRHNTLADLFFSGSRWISYWLNAVHYSLGKFDPFSYRVGNVLIHILNGTLVFTLLHMLLSKTKSPTFFSRHSWSLATLTATLFLLHPAHTQTVSYVIQGQLEGLATLSILLMILFYTFFAHASNGVTRAASCVLLLAVTALSVGTKEIAIVGPILLCITDWFLIAQGDWRSLKTRAWLLGAVTAISGVLYVYFLKPSFFQKIFTFSHVMQNNIGNVLTQNPADTIKPYDFFISQFKVIIHYLVMYLWPFDMSVEYDWKLSTSIFAPDAMLPLLVLIAIGALIAIILRKNRTSLLAFGALWFFISVAPRSSFIPSSELLADYKAYLASIGWLFIIAVCGIKLFEVVADYAAQKISFYVPQSIAALVGLVVMCVPLGIATTNQNNIWSSGLEFWGAMIKNAPGKARAYNNYGVELAQNLKRWKESVPYYQKAIAMDAHYADPCNNLAVAYAQLNDIDNAILAIKKGLKINPNFPEGYNNLAAFYLQKNDLDAAMKHLKLAIKLRPYYGKAHYNLGRVYLQQNKLEEAWSAFKDCCMNADMDTEVGFACYAQTSFALKKYEDTIHGCQKILEINPRNEQALFHLANSLFLLGRYEHAAQAYENMLNYYPNDQRALFNAGETYMRLKNPSLALSFFERCERQPNHAKEVYQRLASCRQILDSAQA